MNPFVTKKIAVAALLMLAVPASLLAQEDKKEAKKGDVEQIIITRKGAVDTKTVIEITGDKITVDGKVVNDDHDGDVRVMRHKLRDVEALTRAYVRAPNFNFEFNEDHLSLFTEDSNRAMMGVSTKDYDDDKEGAEITSVSKGSAAEKAGLQAGDIITKIGNKNIENAEDVSKAVREHKPGERVDVAILRKGKAQKVTVELDKWKGVNVRAMSIPRVMDAEMWSPSEAPAPPFQGNIYYGGQPRLGLSIQDTEDGKGVKVLRVAEESNAAKAGLEEDDIITHINDKAVNSADEVSKLVKEAKDKASFTMKVLRDGKARTLEVRTPRRLKTTNL